MSDEFPLAKRLSAFGSLSDGELEILHQWGRRQRLHPDGHSLLREGEKPGVAYIVVSGWLFSYKILLNGGRQVVNFHIPGDFVGLPSIMLRSVHRSVDAITPVWTTAVHLEELREVFVQAPRLGAAILWSASRDEAVLVERLVGLGRRSAIERTAHLFLEFSARLMSVEHGTPVSFACPVSQYILADGLGLTAIHLNRVLRDLRENGLMTFRNGWVTIHDYPGLAEIGGFEGGYLSQEIPCNT